MDRSIDTGPPTAPGADSQAQLPPADQPARSGTRPAARSGTRPAARSSPRASTSSGRAFVARALAVIAYALAMGYLEGAVVVYLRAAVGIEPGSLSPIPHSDLQVDFTAIEVGREAATLVMLAAVGWIAGRRPLERLAWVAVAFGVWDISYYGWLWVFVGWPPSIDTWDVLFLIPVPWTAPVWAPCAVSAALVGFGLAAARLSAIGRRLHVSLLEGGAAVAGGVVVYASFTIDAPRVQAGSPPGAYLWPLFALGIGLAIVSGVSVLRRALRSGEPPGAEAVAAETVAAEAATEPGMPA